MNALVSTLLPVFICILALCAIKLRGDYIPLNDKHSQLQSIEGLRGYLAIGVFVHHAYIWYEYLHSGKWEMPQSVEYAHLGRDAVALFFMITAFLFVRKLLATEDPDWLHLYTGRIFRIMPLYWFMLCLLLLIVGIVTNWILVVSVSDLIKSILRWGAGGVLIYGPVNKYEETSLIICSVTWTLSYEWLFYFMLPILGMTIHKKFSLNNICAMLVSVIAVAYMWHAHLFDQMALLNFVGGVVVAFLYDVDWLQKFCKTKKASILLLSLTGVLFVIPQSPILIFFVLTCAFLLIVSGCSIFGILTSDTSRRLGEISYSIYLLHGIFLFITFKLLLPSKVALLLTHPYLYWAIVSVLVVLIVLFCQFTYKRIELKGLQMKNNFF